MDNVVKKNILALLMYQGSALLMPLITLPYIARVLGVVEFGRLGLCLAITQYFVLLVDYGFNLSVTAKVAKIQQDSYELTKVFFTTYYAKVLLLIVGMVILCLLSSFALIRDNIGLLACCYLIVIGNFLFPLWFLQGIEQMEVIANTNLLARISSIPLILLFVHTSQDVYKVALIQGFTSLMAAILALIRVYRLKLLTIHYMPRFAEVKATLQDSWHYFVSISSVSLYTNTNILILGLMANSTAVGYFAGVDKIKNAMLSVTVPFTQAIYPKVIKLMQENEEQAFLFIAKYLIVFGLGSLIYSILIFLCAPLIVMILLGKEYINAIQDLQVLAFLPFLVVVNNFFGTQIMLSKNKQKAFMVITIFGGLINVISLFLLAYNYGDLGASISILSTEFIITTVMYAYIHKKIPRFTKVLKSLMAFKYK